MMDALNGASSADVITLHREFPFVTGRKSIRAPFSNSRSPFFV